MGKNTGWRSSIIALEQPNMIGRQAEKQACIFLERQGLRLLCRNYLCRFGEIDLVMQDGASLAFIEVRFRKSSVFGSAIDSINYLKQQKLIKTAMYYLKANRLSAELPCRFDVIAMTLDKQGEFQISWIQNAFSSNY
jgi:putative endonuclease